MSQPQESTQQQQDSSNQALDFNNNPASFSAHVDDVLANFDWGIEEGEEDSSEDVQEPDNSLDKSEDDGGTDTPNEPDNSLPNLSELFAEERRQREERLQLDKEKEKLQSDKEELDKRSQSYADLEQFKSDLAELAQNDPVSLLSVLGVDSSKFTADIARKLWNSHMENETADVLAYRKARELVSKNKNNPEIEQLKQQTAQMQAIQKQKEAEAYQQMYKSKLETLITDQLDNYPALKQWAQGDVSRVLTEAYNVAVSDAQRRFQANPNSDPMTPEETLQALENVLAPVKPNADANQPKKKKGITLNSQTTTSSPQRVTVPDTELDLDKRIELAMKQYKL